MSLRDEFLSTRFNEWLDRFSPPRAIQNNPKAMQDDADAMLRTILRYAPRDEYAEWLDRVLIGLAENMTTRSWPAPGELVKACKAGKSDGSGANVDMIEHEAVNRMVAWFEKFKSELPGHGHSQRTAELINRGVLKNEREARFYGFNISDAQRERAMAQPMGRDEWKHHVRVLAAVTGRDEEHVEFECRRMAAVGPVVVPDKSSPHKEYTEDWA